VTGLLANFSFPAPNGFDSNIDFGSLDIAPNLNRLSVLGLKLNKLSILGLLSSILENNEFWVVLCNSVDPKIEDDPVVENEPNIGTLEVTVEERSNKFVDFVSVEKLPPIGTLGVVFSNILDEDLLPNRKGV